MSIEIKKKNSLNVFLSYSSKDRLYAEKILSLLAQKPKIRVFTDKMLSAGEDWESRLKEEISRSDLFLVLISSNSVNSKWVLHELGAAWAIDKPIISITINPELKSQIPLLLTKDQLINFEDLDKHENIDRLFDQVNEMVA